MILIVRSIKFNPFDFPRQIARLTVATVMFLSSLWLRHDVLLEQLNQLVTVQSL